MERLKLREVIVTWVNGFYIHEFMNNSHIRICISSVSDGNLEEGIRVISEVITECNVLGKAFDYIL